MLGSKGTSVQLHSRGFLAYWLHVSGFEPILIEHAPSFRTSVIDAWYDVSAIGEALARASCRQASNVSGAPDAELLGVSGRQVEVSVRRIYFFGDAVPPDGPLMAMLCTWPLSQPALNSACESLPSLFVSTALKSLTADFACASVTLPDFALSSLFQID